MVQGGIITTYLSVPYSKVQTNQKGGLRICVSFIFAIGIIADATVGVIARIGAETNVKIDATTDVRIDATTDVKIGAITDVKIGVMQILVQRNKDGVIVKVFRMTAIAHRADGIMKTVAIVS